MMRYARGMGVTMDQRATFDDGLEVSRQNH